MCGICGFAYSNGQHVDDSILHRMMGAIGHRGPDADGVYSFQNIGLAHVRLSILDLSEAANQPMLDEEGNVILIFNGE